MEGKKALLAAYFHWGSFLHMGAHQFASQFARNGYQVAFLSEMISAPHLALNRNREEFREKRRQWLQGGRWTEEGRLWAYTPLSLLPVADRPLLRSRWILDHQPRLTIPRLSSVLKKRDFREVDVLYLDEPFDFYLDIVKHRKSVFRFSENILPLFEQGREHLLARARRVVGRVDLVLVTARGLEERARALGARKILYLPGGADFALFNDGPVPAPKEYEAIPGPRAVFVGNLAYWMDLDLLDYAAQALPDFSFVLVGQPSLDMSRLERRPNVHILGKRDHARIPALLRHADVGIIPFATQFPRMTQVHPIKLYEYMSCGLPVVSVSWPEIKAIQSPAYLAGSREEFVALLRQAPGEKDAPRFRAFAQANTWDKRFEKLEEALASL